MSKRRLFLALPTLICLLFTIFTSSPAVPYCDIQAPGRDDGQPPRLSLDPGSFEADLPFEVTGLDTLVISNQSGSVVRFSIAGQGGRRGFRGEYFRNAAGAAPQLGEKVLDRLDTLINFAWGNNAPANVVGADNFGARWTAYFVLREAGRYNFRVNVDDGAKLWIDDQLVIDEWADGNARDLNWGANMQVGTHRVRLEMYNNQGNAQAKLLWQPMAQGAFVAMPAFYGEPWLLTSPGGGQIAARGNTRIGIQFVTRYSVANNNYVDTLRLETNDRENPLMLIPVSLHVGDWQPGALVVDPDHLYREMQAGARAEVQLVLNSVGQGNYEFQSRIEGVNPNWLTSNLASGLIGPGLSRTMTLTLNTANLGNGVYSAAVLLTSTQAGHEVTTVPVTISIGVPFGAVFGRVVDALHGNPIENARVELFRTGFVTATDANGRFTFDRVPVMNCVLKASSRDFLPATSAEFAVREGERAEVNSQLRQAEFVPVPTQVEASLPPDDTFQYPLAIENHGNGALTWRCTAIYPADHVVEQWTERLRFEVTPGDIADNRINGLEIDNDGNFYVTGGNNGRGRGNIYVFNTNGEYVRRFPQFIDSQFGMRDLAWDGELLWGADGAHMYGFDTEGNLVHDFQVNINPARAIAYDQVNELFYICDVTSDLFVVNRDGGQTARLRAPGVRRYGLAWNENDADGFKLYMFQSDNDHPMALSKYNPATAELRFVRDLVTREGDRAGGLAISGVWDPYNYVITGVGQDPAQGNDIVCVWELAGRGDWLQFEPANGVVEAGAESDVTITFSSASMPPEHNFDATLRFNHDGIGLVTEVPVQMSVTGIGGITQRVVSLQNGWNLVSANLTPENGNDFSAVVAPLVDAGALLLAKDGAGHFYWPARGFDGIDAWNGHQGYWIKVNQPTSLTISGEVIGFDAAIGLQSGWNMVSYLPRQPVEAPAALAGLGDNLQIARNGEGRFYLPSYQFSDMGRLREGLGYQLRVANAGELVYRLGGRAAVGEERYTLADLSWIRDIGTSSSMSQMLVISSLPTGTRIEATTPSGSVAGRGVVGEDGKAGLTLWGKDLSSDVSAGFRTGDPITLRSLSTTLGAIKMVEGEMTWQQDGLAVVELANGLTPARFGLQSAYPNPFNGELRISFGIENAGDASLRAFDVAGREVGVLTAGHFSAGEHRAVWTAAGLPSGIYMLKLESTGKTSMTKVVMVR